MRRAPKPEKPGELTVFAKAIGCKRGLEPIPHDQIEALQDKRSRPWLRVLACLWLHQFPRYHRARFIKEGHEGDYFSIGKPHATCCNQCKGRTGKPVQPVHVGNHLGMDEGNVRRQLEFLESEKRIVWEREETITVVADFVLPELSSTPPSSLEQTTEQVCADLWSGPIANQIIELGQPKIGQLIFWERKRLEWFNTSQADLDAANRSIWDDKQDSMLQSYGVKPFRQEHEPKDPERQAELAARRARIKRLIPTLQKYAQTFDAEVCADLKNGFAQTSDATPNPMFTGVRGASTEVEPLKGGRPGSSSAAKIKNSVSQSPTDRLTEQEQAIHNLLVETLGEKTQDTPTPRLCRAICAALQGAPLLSLRSRIQVRYEKITGMGIALNLAEAVGKHWVESARARQAPSQPPPRLKAEAETVAQKIRRLQGDAEAADAVAADARKPPAERHRQSDRARKLREQIAALEKADAVGGS